MANNRFFTNTYITGSGRTNYLRIKDLEDPLFTSFTFDIDFNTSPLFYTIKPYTLQNNNGLSNIIENALKTMHDEMYTKDQGYDILPLMSSSFLGNGHKLGFGIQQNVYLDQPLYGATEYIYMVDKRNGGSDQNDVRYGNGGSKGGSTSNSNVSNSYKLGDSVKNVVNESDVAWAEKQQKQNDEIINQCNEILTDQKVIDEHIKNKDAYKYAENIVNNTKVTVNGKRYSEAELENEIKKLKSKLSDFDKLKKDIVDWVNKELEIYRRLGTKIYMENNCVQDIYSYDNIGETEKKQISQKYGNNLISNIHTFSTKFCELYVKIFEEFLDDDDGYSSKIKDDKIINKFGTELNRFGLILKDKTLKGGVYVNSGDISIEWVTKTETHLAEVYPSNGLNDKILKIMSWECDMNNSFDVEFTSDDIDELQTSIDELETGLSEIKYSLYGTLRDGDGFNKNNPDPDSAYGQYKEAKEKFENDEYSQAEKAKEMASSGYNEMSQMICDYKDDEYVYEENVETGVSNNINNNTTSEQISAPQTVLDILGFISGMKQMITDYPYIIQGITGLDTAYNKHYGIKDPYLGSGEDKITLTCLESIDLRVSSMFNRYFNAVYDRQYRRERVPINLRRFNCSVYVHDVRNFVSNMRNTGNRILELKDMYYSVIEFKFYDCEIVPEETGNIFNDISNEAPSEMKKTNFTFTYGNCVVNFNPSFSELVRHNQHIFWE